MSVNSNSLLLHSRHPHCTCYGVINLAHHVLTAVWVLQADVAACTECT